MVRYLRLIFLFLSFIICYGAYSQQDVQFSQFTFNKFIYNPATAGADDALNVTAFYRNQWVGLPGHPVSQSVFVEMPLYRINSGIGISFINDALGAERNMGIKAAYSYIMELGNGNISFGLSAGIVQKSLDGDILTTPGGVYEENLPPNHNDPFLPETKVSAISPDLGAGVYYSDRRLNLGLGVAHLLEPRITFDVSGQTSEIQYKRHINLIAGYQFQLSRALVLQPSIIARTDLAVHQLDLNAILIYNQNFWGGISFRGYNNSSTDAVIGMVGLNLTDRIRFGYSYDFNLSSLQSANSGSHELFINYRLPLERQSQGKIINNPRFLYN